MSTKTSIEWTDVTWNPVRGCSLVSAGCTNCYAMKQAHRFSGPGKPYDGLTEIGPHGPRWNGKIRLVPELLDEPLHWKTPRRVFVNSMSDLFHPDIDHQFLRKVFAVMALTPQHTYQVLTKRPARMQDKLSLNTFGQGVLGEAWSMLGKLPKFNHQGVTTRPWPLPNVWLGVSVEDQATADERIPILLQTPAAVRFISVEPLLAQINLDRWWLTRSVVDIAAVTYGGQVRKPNPYPSLNWVIVGGESGPGARPCDLQWIRVIAAQCMAAGVPVFVKQLGVKPRCSVNENSNGVVQVMERHGQYAYLALKDRKGGDMAEWPTDLRVREFPR